MKRRIVWIFLLAMLCALILPEMHAAKTEAQAMDQILRLHVRAHDDSEREQALKQIVRDAILQKCTDLLVGCEEKDEAMRILRENAEVLRDIAQKTVQDRGFSHPVLVSITRERFEYREYDGFFLPEGEYDTLCVEIGDGVGQNWWCVVFPSACYVGATESVETDPNEMPSCFRLADRHTKPNRIRWKFRDLIRDLFSDIYH